MISKAAGGLTSLHHLLDDLAGFQKVYGPQSDRPTGGDVKGLLSTWTLLGCRHGNFQADAVFWESLKEMRGRTWPRPVVGQPPAQTRQAGAAVLVHFALGPAC